jgi:hypothetical protein
MGFWDAKRLIDGFKADLRVGSTYGSIEKTLLLQTFAPITELAIDAEKVIPYHKSRGSLEVGRCESYMIHS